jgi:hypothetical protein
VQIVSESAQTLDFLYGRLRPNSSMARLSLAPVRRLG